MVTLTIDDETYEALRKQAAASGLSVEDWLKSQGVSQAGGQPPMTASAQTWHQRLMAFAERHRPTGAPLDTSREAIYD